MVEDEKDDAAAVTVDERVARLEQKVGRLQRRNTRLRRRARPARWIASAVGILSLLPWVLGLVTHKVFLIWWGPLAVALTLAAPVAWWRTWRRERRIAQRRAARVDAVS